MHILPAVVFAQFAGTSVWFATNAVIADLEASLGTTGLTVWLTSAVQVGFIVGSGLLAITRLADRVPTPKLFFVATLVAAASNAAVVWLDVGGLLVARFVCGLALAGIYPVGMKAVAGWYQKGLGGALGWLVGALVLGTAFPHLLRASSTGAPLQAVIMGTSALAVLGGLIVRVAVPPGPYQSTSPAPELGAVFGLGRNPEYRAAALGYFGHMWELYTLWAVLPAFFAAFVFAEPGIVSALTFLAVAVGAVGCVAGGLLANRWGSRRVASAALLASAACCALAPFVFQGVPAVGVGLFLLFWGLAAVADSPQLSTLTAQGAPGALRGTGLALATAIGFGLTVVSLAVVAWVPLTYVPWMLLPGPLGGLLALNRRGG